MKSKFTEFDGLLLRYRVFSGVGSLKLIPLLLLFFFAVGPAGCATVNGRGAQKMTKPTVEAIKPKISRSEKPDATQKAYENFALASVALNQGRYQDARKHLETAIQYDPNSVYLNTKMAILLKGLKQYPEALAYARKSVGMDPQDPAILVLLGDLYALTGKDELAIVEYRNILKQDPDNKRVRLLLTTILVRKKQFENALLQLDILIKQDPELIIAYYYQGRINLEMGRYKAAERSLNEALKRNKTLEPALFDKATLYQITRRNPEAIMAYERLLSLYPDNISARERLVEVYLKLGQKSDAARQVEQIKKHSTPGEPERQVLGLIYLKQGKIDASIAELDLIVTAWPKDYKSRYYLATAYEEKGDNDKALEQFKLIDQKSTYYRNAQMHIIHLMILEEKFDEALKALEQLMAMDRNNTDLYLMLAAIHEAQEKYDKAIDAVKEGLTLDEKNVNLRFRLGVLLDKAGRKEACIREMRQLLKIDPNNVDALNYIGYTYAEQNVRLDEALFLIQKALKLKPDSGYIIDSLGWVYFQKGQYKKALRTLQKAATLTGEDPTVQEHLGDAYFKLKEYQKALQSYEKALSLKHPEKARIKEKIAEVRDRLKTEN